MSNAMNPISATWAIAQIAPTPDVKERAGWLGDCPSQPPAAFERGAIAGRPLRNTSSQENPEAVVQTAEDVIDS